MKNKKTLKVIAIIALVVVLLILASTVGNKSDKEEVLSNDPTIILANAREESASVKENEKKEFIQIDINEYMNYYNGEEPTLILLARPTCGYCQIAEPIIQNIAYEYNLDIHYLNTDNFTDEAQTTFVQSDEFFNTGYGTPILYIVMKGQILDKVDGLTDRAHYVEFLRMNGYIK